MNYLKLMQKNLSIRIIGCFFILYKGECCDMAKMSESNNQVEMFACANCGLEVRTKHSEFVEGTNCPKCKKPLFLVGQKNNMNLKINVEVSEALKGLKAVQREARKATAALKELEEQQKRNLLLPPGLKTGIPESIIRELIGPRGSESSD
jgi:Zn finger protein HypA/HybF involved in hydrogenase expression